MPLGNFFRSLLGLSSPSEPQTRPTRPDGPEGTPKAGGPTVGKRDRNGRKTPTADGRVDRVESSVTVAEPDAMPPDPPETQPLRGKPPRRKVVVDRADAGLIKLVRGENPTLVCEIGVGNGRRAVAIQAALAAHDGQTPRRHVAIDSFEMGGGSTTLMDFHKHLRSARCGVNVIPLPIEAAIAKMARTFGLADLIVICETAAMTPAADAALRRICKPTTRVIRQVGGRWSDTPVRSAAAA